MRRLPANKKRTDLFGQSSLIDSLLAYRSFFLSASIMSVVMASKS